MYRGSSMSIMPHRCMLEALSLAAVAVLLLAEHLGQWPIDLTVVLPTATLAKEKEEKRLRKPAVLVARARGQLPSSSKHLERAPREALFIVLLFRVLNFVRFVTLRYFSSFGISWSSMASPRSSGPPHRCHWAQGGLSKGTQQDAPQAPPGQTSAACHCYSSSASCPYSSTVAEPL